MISMLYIAWYSKSLLVTQTQYIWEFNIITQMILQLCKVATWHIRQHTVCCMHWFWSLKISTQFLSLEYTYDTDGYDKYFSPLSCSIIQTAIKSFCTKLMCWGSHKSRHIIIVYYIYIHIGGITNFWGMLLVVNELNDAVSTEQLIKWCLNQQRISILSMAYKWQIHRIGWLTWFSCPLYISL